MFEYVVVFFLNNDFNNVAAIAKTEAQCMIIGEFGMKQVHDRYPNQFEDANNSLSFKCYKVVKPNLDDNGPQQPDQGTDPDKEE